MQLEYGISGWSQDKDGWFSEAGIPCEVLRFSANGWQKGKVRINLEFCPVDSTDESQEISVSSDHVAFSEPPASVADELDFTDEESSLDSTSFDDAIALGPTAVAVDEFELGTSADTALEDEFELGTSADTALEDEFELGTSADTALEDEFELGTSADTALEDEFELGTSADTALEDEFELGTLADTVVEPELDAPSAVYVAVEQEVFIISP